MAIPNLNFSTGNVVDPTRGAMLGLESARGALTDMMKQGLAEEELAKQEARQKVQDARQKVLDDRATVAYTQQQQELSDRQKFGKEMLGDTQIRYADANSSDMVRLMKNVELTPEEAALSNKGIETPKVKAKLKAQMELGQQFENSGVRETEWEKAQRIAKETGVGSSLGVQERLYEIKAADVKAREDKKTSAKAATDALLAKRDSLAKEMRGYSVVERSALPGTSEKSSYGEKSSSGKKSSDLWTPKDNVELQAEVNKLSPLGYGPDTTQGEKLLKYMQSRGVGPKQASNILAKMGVGPETMFSGEKLSNPGNPNATDEEVMNYGRQLVDATIGEQTSTSPGRSGRSGGSGGMYTKKDNSTAIKLLKAELNSVDKQLTRLGVTNYDAPEGSPEERSMDKMNSLAKKYWSKIPATGESPKKIGGSSTSTVKKSILIPGKIGAAMSSNTPGDVARLSLLPEFADEYEGLTKSQQARVDKLLGSAASKKVYDGIKVNNDPSPTTLNMEKAKKGDGTISTEELKKILEQEDQSYRSNAPKALFNNPSAPNTKQPWWNKNVNVGELIADTTVGAVKGLGNLPNSIPELYRSIDEFQGKVGKGGDDLIRQGITSFGANSREEILDQNTLNRKVNNLSSSAKEKFSANLEKLTKKYNGTKSKSKIMQEALDEVNK